MTAIAFPSYPTNGQEYTHNGVTYEYEAVSNKWKVVPATEDIDGGSY